MSHRNEETRDMVVKLSDFCKPPVEDKAKYLAGLKLFYGNVVVLAHYINNELNLLPKKIEQEQVSLSPLLIQY